MAELIPWDDFEEEYAKLFQQKKVRQPNYLEWH